MRAEIKDDYYRMTGEKYSISAKTLATLLFSHQIRYMRLWRKANKKMTIFRRLRLWYYSRKYGLEISPTANIGKGLYLGHPYNITVGIGVKIGNNVTKTSHT